MPSWCTRPRHSEPTTTAFTHTITSLAPGAELVFNGLWNTTGTPEGDYGVIGYVKYNARTSEVETVTLTTLKRVYLPLIQRASP